MAVVLLDTPFNIPIEFELAQWHQRMLAYLIDFAIQVIYLLSMSYVLIGGLEFREAQLGFVLIVLLLPTLLYPILTEFLLQGQTLGKMALGIRVVSLDGGEPELTQYMLRWFVKFFDWGFWIFALFWGNGALGFFWLCGGTILASIVLAITAKSQRLGDLAARTVVVSTRTKISVQDTIFMAINEQAYRVTFPEVMRLSDRDINTIKTVLDQAQKTGKHETCQRVALKVQEVLHIESTLCPDQFLEKVMADYNYLSTREN